MLPLRLVVDTNIDTNIVVSAALKPDGLQRTVVLLAVTKPAKLYFSTAILSGDVLSRPELRIRKAHGCSFFNSYGAAAILFPPPSGFKLRAIPTTISSLNVPMPLAPITW
jgi:hypothetical protein